MLPRVLIASAALLLPAIAAWPAPAQEPPGDVQIRELPSLPPPKLSIKQIEDKSPPKGEADTDDEEEEEEAMPQYNTVILQGLNKVTGHISRIDGPTGAVLRFGNLEIIARRCWKAPPDERPENAALLEIRELQPGEDSRRIFLGWMFSSSPGLSGLEHAVYDITMLNCEFRADPEKKEALPEKKSGKKDGASKKKGGKKSTKSSGKDKKPPTN